MLCIEKLTFGWEDAALFEDVDFQLTAGEIVRLTGDNGTGKYTLLRLISGMIPHFQRGKILKGDIRFDDRSVFNLPPKPFFPNIAWIPCNNTQLFLMNENLDDAFTLVRAVLRMDDQTSATRYDRICRYFPEVESLKSQSFQKMAHGHLYLSLLLLTYYQGARLFLLDEILKYSPPEDEIRLFDFLHDLCDSGCSILIATHRSRSEFDRTCTIRNGTLC